MKPVLLALLILSALPATGKRAVAAPSPLPPVAAHSVDFRREIEPVLSQRCAQCHGRGKAKGGFRIDTRADFLKGGDSGPAAIIGQSQSSHVIQLIAGVDPDNVMPEKGQRLTPQEVGVFRAWIDQGLNWDPAISFSRREPLNLHPRRPAPPQRPNAGRHPIDRFIDVGFERQGLAWPEVVDNRTFARRVYLDLIGLLPPPEELDRFERSSRRDKRQRLVDQLLERNSDYAEHWITFWNDMLRNDYRGTGYIDGGRKQITTWLYSALATNMPFDRFVAALVNPTENSEGFTKGIVWRGVVNASQAPPMQAAQNISQVFLGTNLKCASCHDSFINDWTLAEAYGLANLYADEALEIHRCDRPIGEKAVSSFIFPELGGIDPGLGRKDRLQRLASLLATRDNGRLTRTFINRLWAQLLGRGLVEPVDDMDQRAWNPDLLDWLAEDFADHDFDVKHALRRITTSKAYQLPSVGATEAADPNFAFRGPTMRRLSAEQFRDAVGSVASLWHHLPRGEIVDFWADLSPRRRRGMMRDAAPEPPEWIWHAPDSARDAADSTVYFRKSFALSGKPAEAFLVAAADDSYTLYLNGTRVTSGRSYKKPQIEDVRRHLVAGTNWIAVSVQNGDEKKPEKDPKQEKTEAPPRKPNPAGLVVYLDVHPDPSPESRRGGPRPLRLVTDSTWLCSTNKIDQWEKPEFVATNWTAAVAAGELETAPWLWKETFAAALSTLANRDQIRASLVEADPLMTALGRPNREQVVTARSSSATTLQALELTNGQSLNRLLEEGARKLAAESNGQPAEIVRRIYRSALGRDANPAEHAAAGEILMARPGAEGVQDLLWAVLMLPEFQLIF